MSGHGFDRVVTGGRRGFQPPQYARKIDMGFSPGGTFFADIASVLPRAQNHSRISSTNLGFATS